MLKLKFQYFGHLIQRIDSLEKTPMLGKIEGRRRRGRQRLRWLDGITRLNGHGFEKALGVGDRQGSLVCFSPFGCKELDMTEQLNGLTGANNRSCRCLWSNNEVQSSFTLELLVWKLYSTPIPLPPFYLENTICLTESKWYLKLCSVCVMQ